MIKIVPVFQGYTVDVRLKEFRKVDPEWGMEFVSFDSDKGDIMLQGFIDTIDADTREGLDLLVKIWM